jgi:hypothetical protein
MAPVVIRRNILEIFLFRKSLGIRDFFLYEAPAFEALGDNGFIRSFVSTCSFHTTVVRQGTRFKRVRMDTNGTPGFAVQARVDGLCVPPISE